MIKLQGGFEIEANVSTAVVNYNDGWHKIIVVESDVEGIADILKQHNTFDYDNLRYMYSNFVWQENNCTWLEFKDAEIIVDEITPLKERMAENTDYLIDVDFRVIMLELDLL